MMKRYPYKQLPKYPHLLAEDTALWNNFISQYPDRFVYCDYDYHVGDGIDVPADWPESYRNMATTLSQFRIDVIGWNADIPTIIEVKPRARTTAIGQVLVYYSLFIKQHPEYLNARKMIVTDWKHEEITAVAFEHNIAIVTV